MINEISGWVAFIVLLVAFVCLLGLSVNAVFYVLFGASITVKNSMGGFFCILLLLETRFIYKKEKGQW